VSRMVAILARELRVYFTSPIAYVVLTALLVVNGLDFFLIVDAMNEVEASFGAPFAPFFGGFIFYWFFMLVVPPVLTMRLISEELRSGTLETLMTAPVTDTQVVIGKYLASLIFFVVLWLPTLLYVIFLSLHTELDPGPLLSGYLGTLLLGAMFLAAGVFASSLTRNQVVAAVLTFTLTSTMFCAGLLEYLQPSQAEIWSYFNLHSQMLDFGKGVVDSRPVVYCVSTTLFLLFVAVRVLERRRWS